MTPAGRFKVPQPENRLLQVFAFDPSLNLSLETAVINQLTLSVPWEGLKPGPVGEYLEVVDVDPASQSFYPPVDLDDPYLLVQDGLSPSEGTPQFHQQMVYAVASRTIHNFEQALGRRMLWSPRRVSRSASQPSKPQYVQRLRLYPHALREANAYYSPEKKAILFGYFPASTQDAGNNLPGGLVFTCLSYDIAVHEVTHALLDGLHPYFTEPSNVDVIALHEAFADVVALFQHFSHPDVLRHQIARTRGDLSSENLLAELAQQFGQATGHRAALRSAIGGRDPQTGEWKRRKPDPASLGTIREPHARGAILLAAVFDAFLAVYKSRSADLLRIATGGSGVLPEGAIHPDLVNRLAEEAAKIAGHILKICIRALDYCPPVDVNFGEYLRAVITADADLVPVDRAGYRIALIESFRRHGIYPSDVRSLSEESLLWRPPEHEDAFRQFFANPLRMARIQRMRMKTGREQIFEEGLKNNRRFEAWLVDPDLVSLVADELGLSDPGEATRAIERALRLKLWDGTGHRSISDGGDGRPAFRVNSVRPAYRIGPDGQTLADLVVEVDQQRAGYFDRDLQKKVDQGELPGRSPDFIFRGGTTLLIDMTSGRVRYAIGKSITSDRRLEAQRRFYEARGRSLGYTYFGDSRLEHFSGDGRRREPFALLHRGERLEEEF